MALRELVTEPDSLLRERSQEISPEELLSPETQTLIDDMIETMKANNGIGLAAVQVGVLKRIIVVTIDKQPKVFINPEITSRSLKTIVGTEACLSIPGKDGIVKRQFRVTVKAQDRHGADIEVDVNRLPAVVFQHEIDHLDGILFTDKTIN